MIYALSVVFLIFLSPTEGKDIKVGGEAGWTHTTQYADIEASVGDRLVSRAVCPCRFASLPRLLSLCFGYC